MNKIKTILAATASGAIAVAMPVSVLAYGPSEGYDGRKYFDFNDTSTYPNYPAFNSFKNSPSAGFEPDFMSIKKSTDNNWDGGDGVTLERGVTYDVFVYYHNNAPLNTNTATNTRIWVDFPAVVKAGTSVKGTANLSADNATPKSIWSTLTFRATNDTLLRYVQGSAFIKYADGTIVDLPNEGKDLLTKPGQLVGKDFSGNVPGCDANSGYVQFQIVADQPDFTVDKQVRVNNDRTAVGGWTDSVDAKKGDIVDFIIQYTNTGTIQQNNVVVKDILPAGFEYIEGSSVLYNGKYPTSVGGVKIADGVTSSTGINIGSYLPGADAMVKFSVKVTSNDCSTVKNVAHVITANGSHSDDASVKFDNVCEEPETPEIPKELPKTGTGSIVASALGVASVTTAAAYFVRSRKNLN